MSKLLMGIIGVAVILGAMFFGTYNKLVTLSTGIDGQWAQVETQY